MFVVDRIWAAEADGSLSIDVPQREPPVRVPDRLYRRLLDAGITTPDGDRRLSREQLNHLISEQPVGQRFLVHGWCELAGIYPRN